MVRLRVHEAPVTDSVDVIIAAWNRGDTIERAMLSALAEPEVRVVILIDDCSTDNTAGRARRVAAEHGERVVVMRLPVNSGPAAARNAGLTVSIAPWIAILDGDDFFLPGRVGTLLSHAAEFDFVADNLIQTREGSAELRPFKLLEAREAAWKLDLEGFVLGNVTRRGRLRKELGFVKPLMRRSFLDFHGLRYDEGLRLGEDYALYAQALALGARFLITSDCGYVSVERDDSLSSRHSMEDLERLRDVDRDFGKIRRLTTAERRAIRRHYNSVDGRVQWIEVINAVKAGSISRFVAPFFRSGTVTWFLIRNLIEQVRLRGGRRLSNLRLTSLCH
jgi:succinoglycan biosynthesis protein ExoU